jgi:hypothetical protein
MLGTTLEMKNVEDCFERMLEGLPPVFNKDPEKRLAFTVSHSSGALLVTIRQRTISARTEDKYVKDFTLSLEGKTLAELVAEINTYSGYTAVVKDFGTASALRLLDTEDDSSGQVYVFTNINWAVMKALAWEMEVLGIAVQEGLRQVSMIGSTGIIQDYWGSFAEVDRRRGEADRQYGQRIVTVYGPKSNEKSIERMLKNIMGIDTTVSDLSWDVNGILLMNDIETPVNDDAFNIYFTLPFKGPGFTFPVGRVYYLDHYLLMNFKGTPVNDPFSIIYTAPDPEPWPSNLFGIILSDETRDVLTADQLDLLIEIIRRNKAATARWRLFWKGTPDDAPFITATENYRRAQDYGAGYTGLEFKE